jgi:hypothetical protein
MISTIIKVIIFIFVIYLGILVAIPWAKYFIYKNSVYKIVNISQSFKRDEIVDLLLQKAEELNIKVKKQNIKIIDYENGEEYVINYKSDVTFPFVANKLIFTYEIKKFRYAPGVGHD